MKRYIGKKCRKQKIHILFISDGDGKYGASQSMKQLISGLLEYCEGVEISVVLPARVKAADYYRQLGCHTYRIMYEPFYQSIMEEKWKMPFKFIIRGTEYLLGRCFGIFCLSRKMDMGAIDIIHSNSSREDFGAMLALKYNKPLIWHIREFGDKDFKCFSFRRNYIELMNESAWKFIAVSDIVQRHWIKKGLNAGKFSRVYDGVVTNTKKKVEYARDKKIKFVMLGALRETKGQYQVIQACRLMTKRERAKLSIDIIGGGTRAYTGKLNRMIKELKLESVIHLLGYRNDMGSSLSRYDCGFMCSKSEAFGRVTAEYMMAGLPVIASNTGANPEIVMEKENGVLYQWNDIRDLKRKIVFMLDNPELLGQMGEKARNYAESHFSVKLDAGFIYKEYLEIMKKCDKNIGKE